MADAFGVAHRVRDRDRPTLRDAQQRKPIQAGGVYHGLEILDPVFKREPVNVPIGRTAAPLVIAQQLETAGQLPEPVPPDRTLPFVT